MSKVETAVLGGGCFWCTEAIFKSIKGVTSVVPGYAGGETKNPSYEEVSSGRTGHAEVIKIEFDSDLVSFKKILEIFFEVHDPTTMNRQGADVGSQYRSIILYTSEKQRQIAEDLINELNEQKFSGKIVTELKLLESLSEFYPAENYHQDYYAAHKNAPYCQIVISPKVKKFRDKFPQLF